MRYVTDPDSERSSGVDIHIRHHRSDVSGMVRATADLDRVEGNSYTYIVRSFDEQGSLLSEGTVVNKKVTLEYLRAKRHHQLKERQGDTN